MNAKPRQQLLQAIAEGWPAVLSSLEPLLETGTACLPRKAAPRERGAVAPEPPVDHRIAAGYPAQPIVSAPRLDLFR
jgi:hypothetical protein